MRIKIISDLHIEFGNYHMLPDFIKGEYDLLVISGDVSNAKSIEKCLRRIDTIAWTPVLFVPGNHEYYGSSKHSVDNRLSKLELKKVTILNDAVFEFEDIVFIGSTCWWDHGIELVHLRGMSDFTVIRDIFVNNSGMLWGSENKAFMTKMLKKYKDKRVICISHNMPSKKCISSKYMDSDLNDCFANDYDDLLYEYKPEYWFCGHTHDSIDMSVYDTKIICNPYGYWKRIENKDFNFDLIIDLN